MLVHDAARPGITPELIRTLVATLKDDPVGGIVALPVADTLKRVPAGGDAIARTESRDALWQAQTPQMFRIGMLREAILRAARRARPDRRGERDRMGRPYAACRAGQPAQFQGHVPGRFRARGSDPRTLLERFLTFTLTIGIRMDFRIGQGYDVHQLVEGRPSSSAA